MATQFMRILSRMMVPGPARTPSRPDVRAVHNNSVAPAGRGRLVAFELAVRQIARRRGELEAPPSAHVDQRLCDRRAVGVAKAARARGFRLHGGRQEARERRQRRWAGYRGGGWKARRSLKGWERDAKGREARDAR